MKSSKKTQSATIIALLLENPRQEAARRYVLHIVGVFQYEVS
jgi:hypothetical protein